MKQAGKLRKDRQLALEKIGLKWSMLATTSWESMFDTLCEYVEDKQKGGAEWDGNVPANYKTEDDPPRALGRWINRQRSAYGKKKLKPEYVSKLNELGLKWSVHERRPSYQYSNAEPDAAMSNESAEDNAESNPTETYIDSNSDTKAEADEATSAQATTTVTEKAEQTATPKGAIGNSNETNNPITQDKADLQADTVQENGKPSSDGSEKANDSTKPVTESSETVDI
jgi:hypothetical protein